MQLLTYHAGSGAKAPTLQGSPRLDRREAHIVAATVMFLGRAQGDGPFSNVALGRVVAIRRSLAQRRL
jgi:hypothetical protein